MTTIKGAALAAIGAMTVVATAGAAAAQSATGLTGMWLLEARDFGRDEKVPLTAAGQAIKDAKMKAIADGKVINDSQKKCLPDGMPTMMGNEFALEFLESPGRITILNEASSLPRSIYLGQKTHDLQQEPQWNGHSIGHWEGKTLVVDTVNLNDKAQVLGFIGVHSSTTHIVERFHLENDGKSLVGEYTFEDPRYLTHPWTQTIHYRRLPDDSQLWEYACEVDAEGWSERFKGDPEAKVAPGG